jgi:hypothetical protein
MNLLNRINSQNLFRVLKHQGLRTCSRPAQVLSSSGSAVNETSAMAAVEAGAIDGSTERTIEHVIDLENKHPEKRAVRDMKPPRGLKLWMMTLRRKMKFAYGVLMHKRTDEEQAEWEQKKRDQAVIRAIMADARRVMPLLSGRLRDLMFYEKEPNAQGSGKGIRIKPVNWDVVAYDWNPLTHMGGNKIIFHIDSRPGALPKGVFIQDLLSDRVLNELQFSVDKPISSHAWVQGGLITMMRTGNNGLPVSVPVDMAWTNMGDNRPMLSFPVGIDENGQFRYKDLSDCPHLLVVGGSRQGKSNMINVVICTFLNKLTPKQCEFVLFDCKAGTEFTFYDKIPHLYIDPDNKIPGIILELNQAVEAMNGLITVMRRRMETIRTAGYKNITDYNRNKRGSGRMPYLVVVFDDYIALSVFFGDDANNPLVMLSSQAAAAGIHIILGAQYPKADRVPSVATLNFQVVVAFRLKPGASGSILGDQSAVGLPCRGRAVFQDFDEQAILQTPFISDAQVRASTDYAITGEHHLKASRLDIEEVLQYALEHLNSNLDIRTLYPAFRGRIGQKKLQSMMKDADGNVYDVKGTLYRVHPGGPGLPRRMVLAENEASTGKS